MVCGFADEAFHFSECFAFFSENCRAKQVLRLMKFRLQQRSISRRTFPAFLSLQRQKLAAEAMQNRTRGEGGDVANLEDDDDEEMWAKLLRRGRHTRRLTF